MVAITEFQSSLLREKFVIFDPDADRNAKKPVQAMSNRMVVTLQKDPDTPPEEYIVRAQNMHSCVRFAGRIINSYNTGGSLRNRATPYDWAASWEPIVNDYERLYNEDRWIAIYHRGQIVFQDGKHHPLLDLIEKCDFQNESDYDNAIPMAENAFKQTGKIVKIDYDANVALVTTFGKNEGRCGVILRGADRTTTFNFSIIGSEEKPLNIAQCLYVSSAFLEGVQLAFLVGMNVFKVNMDIIVRNSAEHQKTKHGQRRLGMLGAEIANLEANYTVRYRPEKPEFNHIVGEAEELASRTINVAEALAAIARATAEAEAAAKLEPMAEKEDEPPESPDKPIDIFDLDD